MPQIAHDAVSPSSHYSAVEQGKRKKSSPSSSCFLLLASSPFHSYVQIRHFLEKKRKVLLASIQPFRISFPPPIHTRLRSLSRWRSIKKSILCFRFCHLSCPCHMMPLPTQTTQHITLNVVWSCQEDRKKLRKESSSSPEPRRLPSLGHSQGVGLSFLACFQAGWKVPPPSCHLAKTLTTPSPPALITSLPSWLQHTSQTPSPRIAR